MLPSGLPEIVEGAEKLSRFLTQSNHFSSDAVTGKAFIPDKHGKKSVARHTGEPPAELWELGRVYLGAEATIYGVAVCVTGEIRALGLDVLSEEPPPRHANIIGWPVHSDAEEQKSLRKKLALAVASASSLILKSA